MSRIRKIAVAGGTFSVALGIGFVMQNGDVLAARFGDPRPQTQAPVAPSAGAVPAISMVENATAAPVEIAAANLAPPAIMTPAAPARETAMALPEELAAPALPAMDLPGMNLSNDTAAPLTGTIPTPDTALQPLPTAFEDAPEPDALVAPPVAAEPECPVTMDAVTQSAAMVDLTLSAPCAPLARVTFHHMGMMFTALTDSDGNVVVTVPALSIAPVFLAELAGGEGAVAMAEVPELAGLDRAVLQWQGQPGLSLHALEFGANYGGEGHVWAGAPRDPGAALTTEGGFLVELGDPRAENPLLAQVYTYPSSTTTRDGEVILSVEAEVTAANCSQDITAQSIQITPDAEPEALDLSMTVPDCSATGEFLILSGMLDSLTIAAN